MHIPAQIRHNTPLITDCFTRCNAYSRSIRHFVPLITDCFTRCNAYSRSIRHFVPLITDCFTKPRNRERGVTLCYTLNLKIEPNKKWHCRSLRPPSRKNFYIPPFMSSDFFLISNNRRLMTHALRIDLPFTIRIAWNRLYT